MRSQVTRPLSPFILCLVLPFILMAGVSAGHRFLPTAAPEGESLAEDIPITGADTTRSRHEAAGRLVQRLEGEVARTGHGTIHPSDLQILHGILRDAPTPP